MRVRGTILVVDDEKDSVALLAGILASEGYEVLPADSGELALASVGARPPELILLDIRMPSVDGFTVCRLLKASAETRDIPIIFLSSARDLDDCVEGLRLGGVDFISKPFRREELLARVETHLELARLRAQLDRRVAERTDELRAANERLQVELAERKRVERALRESEERTRLAMQAGRIHTFAWRPAMDRVRLPGSLAGSPGPAAGRSSDTSTAYFQRVHPDDRECLLRTIAGLTPADDSYDTEYRVIRPNGVAYFRESARALFDNGGRLVRLIGMVADITERKQAEVALRESEERFRNMADTAPVIIWMTDPDKKLTFCSQRGLTFTGRSMEQLAGTGWLAMVHPEDLERLGPHYSELSEARKSFQFECRMRDAAGNYCSVLATGVPRFMAEGAFAGYIGTLVDITDLKRNQERMLENQKLESLGVLAAGIAHDFNNLLGSIFAESDVALSEVPPDSPARDSIERIGAVAIRASEIVNLLMAYAGAGGEDRAFADVDLSLLVQEMIQLLKVSISKKALLEIRLSDELLPIRANAPQIRQVLLNLITNASEALENREGLISVTTEPLRIGGESQVDGKLPEGDYARLVVADTGSGMTAEAQAKAFDPFYTTKFLGRGLGLAAVQGIVRSHGGAINVVSAPGRGTTFEVLLPCAGRDAGDSESTSSSEAAGGILVGTVLLVEDEETLRLSASTALRKAGLSVLEAANGYTAVDLFHTRASEIDIVVLDLTLPGLSGSEVFEEIHAIGPEAKVILTGADDLESGAEAAFPGLTPAAFLRKPYCLGELVSKVGAALPRGAASGVSGRSGVDRPRA
jgi:PAS domain S-box-containing protein